MSLPDNLKLRVKLHVLPGHQAVSAPGPLIHTLLGSCISACLWDSVSGWAGMNHFLLAAHRYPAKSPLTLSDAGRYGITAMELLVNNLLKKGASKSRLRAKVFGGASVLNRGDESFFKIHEVNQRFIKEYFTLEGIPLELADLGGDRARIIYFDTVDHSVWVKYVNNEVTERVEAREEEFWRKAAAKQNYGDVVLFDP